MVLEDSGRRPPTCKRARSARNRPAGESRRQEPTPLPVAKNARYRAVAAVLESIAQIDGSVVVDRDSGCSRSGRFCGIARQRWIRMRRSAREGRTAAAIGASQFGKVLMVSEGGQLSFYQKGHCVWTL